MNGVIVVTVLVENTVYGRRLKGEHGLAFHFQAGSESLLFDTGQSDLLVENARVLNLDLSQLGAVALSHGHYDHTGGLGAVWNLAPQASLYAHPAALGPHFARSSDGTVRDVGITERNRDAARAFAQPPHTPVTPAEVLPGVFLTGEIPRETGFEDTGGPFVLDEAGTEPDPIIDDQALFFDTLDGVVVLLGCAHAGVFNTLRHIHGLTGGRPFHAVLGGTHLVAASEERMTRTIAALRELDIQHFGPAHCTGETAKARLWKEFPVPCMACFVGSRFVFQR
jgi:7,8-dihydropterin-6-yl-methyl-4-(beta-D-ribofuranosyl)aminobenzene 5'-phosphate synthase